MHISGHVSDEMLLGFLDREVQSAERSDIEAHIGRCDACSVRLEGLRAVTARAKEAFETLDVDPPWTGMPAELAKAARDAGVRDITSAPSMRPVRRFSGRTLAVAASLVLLLAAGAWAVPGSPMRAWLSRSFTAVTGLLRTEAPEIAVTGTDDTADTGVFVEPLGGRLRISVQGADAGSLIRVSLTDAELGSVRSTSMDVSYSVGPGLIEVAEAAGEMTVEIPRGIQDARVEIDGRVVVRKRGDELYLTPAADSSTAQILLETGG